MATLTYVYADMTAVLGPLATFAEPHCYDLCESHSKSLTAPRGWDVVRLDMGDPVPGFAASDLEALADAVREGGPTASDPVIEVARRGHLRVLRDGGD